MSADERTPAYYRGRTGLQPLDVIDAWGLGFYDGNAVKYLLRWKAKHGLEDLGKASHYVDLMAARADEDLRGFELTRRRLHHDDGARLPLERISDEWSLGSLEESAIGWVLTWATKADLEKARATMAELARWAVWVGIRETRREPLRGGIDE